MFGFSKTVYPIRFWKFNPFLWQSQQTEMAFFSPWIITISSRKIWKASNVDYLPDFFLKNPENIHKKTLFHMFWWTLAYPKWELFNMNQFFPHEPLSSWKIWSICCKLFTWFPTNFHKRYSFYILHQFLTTNLGHNFAQMLSFFYLNYTNII